MRGREKKNRRTCRHND